jgi:superfamily II DNA/RNA helicase
MCRLLDLHEEGAVSLAAVIVVAIDECDKMLALGFSAQLQRLAQLLLPAPSVKSENAPGSARLNKRGEAADGVSCSGCVDSASKRRKRRRSGGTADELLVPVSEAQTREGGVSVGPSERPQVLLVSATLPADWQNSAGDWVKEGAARVTVSAPGAGCISKAVTQARPWCFRFAPWFFKAFSRRSSGPVGPITSWGSTCEVRRILTSFLTNK